MYVTKIKPVSLFMQQLASTQQLLMQLLCNDDTSGTSSAGLQLVAVAQNL